ncbi:MAG: FAD-dependent oxidoreductase [Leptolyngbyaceae bacterium]|nr:FAD-dependent oxidoreductase [Leptolyngbyaceae bacterium]
MGQHSSCLIVGGGISGLMAAITLQRQGVAVTVVDKGFGIGGRLASRSVKSGTNSQGYFDYGCQFFTAQIPQFQAWLQEWAELGLVQPWSQGFPDTTGQMGVGDRSIPSAQPFCYRGTTSTRSVAQHLAQTLDIRNQTRIERLDWQDSQWIAIPTPPDPGHQVKASEFRADAIILTAPVPQSLELLASSSVVIQPTQQQQLAQVEYDRCLALLVVLERESLIPPPGGLYVEDARIQWLASNSIKGISPHGYAVTIHATPQFSLAHWEDDLGAIAHHLSTNAAPWLGSPILARHVHRWKYSQPRRLHPDPLALLDLNQANAIGPLMLAGDGFTAAVTPSSVERAALSGQAAAQYLLKLWSKP